jgi:hypothetical protein
MPNAAIVALAGTNSHADAGHLINEIEIPNEFADAGDGCQLIFDGAATRWIPELEDPEGEYHDLFQPVKERASVCDFCATAFEVGDAVDAAGIERLDDYDGHPSIHSLVEDGYEIITF